jgi:hypothetical protein
VELFGVHDQSCAEHWSCQCTSSEGRSELLWGEDWTEIVGISSSVVLIPLFGVDVPASSEGIRLGSEFTRTETDNEIELVEIFRPTGLSAGKHLCSSEILKIFVICDDVDRNRGTFEVMTKTIEGGVVSAE